LQDKMHKKRTSRDELATQLTQRISGWGVARLTNDSSRNQATGGGKKQPSATSPKILVSGTGRSGATKKSKEKEEPAFMTETNANRGLRGGK